MAGGFKVWISIQRNGDSLVQRRWQGWNRWRRGQNSRLEAGKELVIGFARLTRGFGSGKRRARAFKAGIRQRHVCPRHDTDLETVICRANLLGCHINIVLAD